MRWRYLEGYFKVLVMISDFFARKTLIKSDHTTPGETNILYGYALLEYVFFHIVHLAYILWRKLRMRLQNLRCNFRQFVRGAFSQISIIQHKAIWILHRVLFTCLNYRVIIFIHITIFCRRPKPSNMTERRHGTVSISDKTSYRKISWSLEAATLVV